MTKNILLFISAIAVIFITGCTGTLPTQTSSVVDDRPTLVFNFEASTPESPVIIFIDNLQMGNAQDFQQGERGLKIISGSHILKLQHLNQNILEKKIYLGSGLTKTININIP